MKKPLKIVIGGKLIYTRWGLGFGFMPMMDLAEGNIVVGQTVYGAN